MFPDMHNFATHQQRPPKRSTILKPFRHNGTCAQGDLVPFYMDAVIPGSTFDIRTSYDLKMLRTPFAPVMDDAYMDAYYFFVPSRILYKKWPQLFGVAEPSAWTPGTDIVLPKFQISAFSNGSGVQPNSALNSLGLPIGYNGDILNPLPFLSYLKIWNDWFRDENLQNSLPYIETYYETASGATVNPANTDWVYKMDAEFLKVNKYHDYFTSALPAPQKNGSPVSLPLGTLAPVSPVASPTSVRLAFINDGSGTVSVGDALKVASSASPGVVFNTDVNGNIVRPVVTGSKFSELASNLYVDLSNATAADVADLRTAIMLQVYFEKLARGGSRYNEYLKTFFGVCPLDATLQRPEFLGGYHKRINMQQVAQTGDKGSIGVATTDTTGALGAFSNTSGSENTFVKSFTEYGYVIGVFAIRVKHRYSQGIAKEWMKSTKYEFFNTTFDRMSEVPVAKTEIFYAGTGFFGFMPAWSEHRMPVDIISGSITPGVNTDLTAWTYGDNYASPPYLSSAWIQEPTQNIEQTLTGTWTVPQFIFDFSIENKATQPISIDSVPNSFGF